MSLPYREGSVFFVPLRGGGFGRGIVARVAPKGRILYGCFFGPRLSNNEVVDFDDLKPSRAILRLRFGDLGLVKGLWRIAGHIPNWKREEWIMPDFVRRDPLRATALICVRYSDADPSHVEFEYPCSEVDGVVADSMSGYGAVEIRLSNLLARE